MIFLQRSPFRFFTFGCAIIGLVLAVVFPGSKLMGISSVELRSFRVGRKKAILAWSGLDLQAHLQLNALPGIQLSWISVVRKLNKHSLEVTRCHIS